MQGGTSQPQRGALMQGTSVDSPYISYLTGPALDTFNALTTAEQSCLDGALNEIEWLPWPLDAREVSSGHALAVRRCGFWIIYERDDGTRELEVWAIVTA
jgi:hypothetical protein